MKKRLLRLLRRLWGTSRPHPWYDLAERRAAEARRAQYPAPDLPCRPWR